MKNFSLLKGLRVILAILIFVPLLLFFLDFSGIMPSVFHGLMHLQLVPALLAGMTGILIFQLVLVLLFGRVYCSVICPAGVLQDIINRIYCIGKKKKKGTRRFRFRKPLNLLRYALLAATFFSAAFGYLSLCLLLDPYSNFGRIASNLFRPVVIWGNNLLADGLMRMDNYSLYHVTLKTITVSSLVAACIALAVFIGFTLWRGRLFCNSICPVGALLSLFSRFSWYRINLDESTCTHCGNCERSCKAEAIDSKSLTVDASRCVECFNCLSVCPKGSVQYLPRNKRTKAEETVVEKPLQLVKADQNSRRTFLATGATIAASLPVVSALAEVGDGHAKGHGKGHGHGKKSLDHALPIVPPGAGSIVRFTELCTGCQLCVTRCPSQVLRPAGLEYGFDYLLKPHMAYISSYCNYECTACAEICPNQAILPITKEEKITTQVGVAHFYKGRCVVNLEEQDCGACAEHCPTQAVHMIPFKGTLTIPSVDPDLCIGCGGCESICPVRPGRAIVIHANKVHQVVEKPEEEEVKEIEIDDFGF